MTPERALIRRRRQILDDETLSKPIPEIPASEDTWVRSLIHRLSGILRDIGGKRPR
jgi:hypothetical protein